VGEKQSCVLFRLRAAVEVAVEEGQNASWGLEEFVAVAATSFPAGCEPGYAGLAVDKLLTREAVSPDCRVKGCHEQGR